MAEYIERKKLIDLCNEIISDDWNKRTSPVSWADAYEGFVEDIERQPVANVAEVKWINVADRLPQDGKRVLVAIDNLCSRKSIYTDIDTDRMVDGKWVRWHNCITHWMPLPEPPKMGGHE